MNTQEHIQDPTIYKLRDFLSRAAVSMQHLSKNSHPAAAAILAHTAIHWDAFSENSSAAAIHLIEQNLDKVNFKFLSRNAGAMDILKKHSDKIDWGYLSANTHPEAIRMLEENPDEIEWMFLSGNPAARELLLANLDKIDWDEFCGNPAMIDVILARARNADGEWALCWETLSSNPAAIQWMLQHQEEQGVYFDTDGLATNTAPEAIALIEQQLRQIGLDFVAPRYRELLSRNPAAIRLFESAGMVVPSLFENPAIFVYDYKKMEENRREFHEELIAAVYHPRRVARRLEMGADWEEFDLEDM